MGLETRVKELEELVAGLSGDRLANADMLQDRRVASTAPTTNQLMAWDATNKAWRPFTHLHEELIQPETLEGIFNNWAFTSVGNTGTVPFVWKVHANWLSTNSIQLVMIPDTEETIQADFDVSVSALNEANDNDDRQSLNETLAISATDVDDLIGWDITSVGTLFDSLAAGDYVAVKVTSDQDLLRVVGLYVSWNG